LSVLTARRTKVAYARGGGEDFVAPYDVARRIYAEALQAYEAVRGGAPSAVPAGER
jgi:hypothetical protein